MSLSGTDRQIFNESLYDNQTLKSRIIVIYTPINPATTAI